MSLTPTNWNTYLCWNYEQHHHSDFLEFAIKEEEEMYDEDHVTCPECTSDEKIMRMEEVEQMARDYTTPLIPRSLYE